MTAEGKICVVQTNNGGCRMGPWEEKGTILGGKGAGETEKARGHICIVLEVSEL